MQEFQAQQRLKMKVPNETIPIEEYLEEPRWLVAAITEADRIETLEDHHFRLKLRPKKFMRLEFTPEADLRVTTDNNGTLHIQSTGCRVLGLENLQESFNLDLSGELTPLHRGEKTWITGTARLQVRFEPPPGLQLLPQAMLKPAGNAFLKGILTTMKKRIRKQLVSSYRQWVEAQTRSEATPSAAAS